jgi:hypothetical protein
MEDPMWNFYKEIFATVQQVTVAVGWAIYQSTFERTAPAAVFFVTMQISALGVSMWASPSRDTRAKIART